MARADKFTQRRAVEELYSDIPINFDKNPVTGNLARLTNEQAVRGSIRQLVLAMRGEWPHYPLVGSKIYHNLFEPLDAVTAESIRTTILQTLAANEPRAIVLRVDVIPNWKDDAYEITIYFQLVNMTDQHVVTELLRRIR